MPLDPGLFNTGSGRGCARPILIPAISKLGALMPKTWRKSKLRDLSAHLYLDVRPSAAEELIAIRFTDTNAELRAATPSSHVHKRLTPKLSRRRTAPAV